MTGDVATFYWQLSTRARLSLAQILGLLLGGVSMCVAMFLSVRPTWVPPLLPTVLVALGVVAIARGIAGLIASVLPTPSPVDLKRYAKSLREDSRTLDVAHLPQLQPSYGPDTSPPDWANLDGRLVLTGGHGSGKSRIAVQVAAERLQMGHHGLHVRLSSWIDSLDSLLLATLSAAAGTHLDAAALKDYLSRRDSFLVFDSLDEAPLRHRELVATQVDQFGQAHPRLDLILTARPQIMPALTGWRRLNLAPLSREQIEEVLGDRVHALGLPLAIERLASNPLMLGLLRAELEAGRKPQSEATLLDAYILQTIVRQSTRGMKFDERTGWRIAEEMAWGWLATGRIGLTPEEIRAVAAGVALAMAASGMLNVDAPAIEQWFIECGLGALVRGTALPTHRALLDHLAGRSVPRHPPDPNQVADELREAIARYVGSLADTDRLTLQYLDGLGTDLEFLARCARLAKKDITWSFSPEEFALSYVAELRRLASGPLAGIGVMPPAVHIQIDPELTWVYEEEKPLASADIVEIVETPPRVYFSVRGGPKVPVTSFRAGGRQGRDIETRIPQLAAFERTKDELLHRLDKQLLVDEGPDIVYERLCRFATRTWEVLTVHGNRDAPEFTHSEIESATAHHLLNFVVAWLSRVTKRSVSRAEVEHALVVWTPPVLGVLLDADPSKEDPYSPSQGRDGLVIHFAPLLHLLDWAESYEIADLPLHPLGLLPESPADPVLALPRHAHALDEDQVRLLVSRHELAEMRAIRHLVGKNLAGLANRISSNATLPWKVTVAVSPNDVTWSGGWSIRGAVESHAQSDEVAFAGVVPEEDWSFSRSLMSYEGVLKSVYRTVKSDLQDLLQGERALGRQDL